MTGAIQLEPVAYRAGGDLAVDIFHPLCVAHRGDNDDGVVQRGEAFNRLQSRGRSRGPEDQKNAGSEVSKELFFCGAALWSDSGEWRIEQRRRYRIGRAERESLITAARVMTMYESVGALASPAPAKAINWRTAGCLGKMLWNGAPRPRYMYARGEVPGVSFRL